MRRPAIDARPATPEDADALAADLRPQDLAEVEALRGPGAAAAAIREGIVGSLWCEAIRIDGALACVVGVVPYQGLLSGVGVPWMLGTPVVDRCAGSLVRLAPAYIARMLADFPRLFNVVDARNTKAVRWLQRAGFVFGDPVPVGVAGLPFYPFLLEL